MGNNPAIVLDRSGLRNESAPLGMINDLRGIIRGIEDLQARLLQRLRVDFDNPPDIRHGKDSVGAAEHVCLCALYVHFNARGYVYDLRGR